MVNRKIFDSKNLCMVNTPYSLFLYFLICGVNPEDIFVLTSKVPKEIRDNINHIYFPYSGVPLNIQKNKLNFLFFLMGVFYEILKLRIKLYFSTRGFKMSVYGHAQFLFSFPFYEYENSYIIEDGTGNYVELRPFKDFSPLKKLFFVKLFGKYIPQQIDGWGTHPNIKKVFLTRNEGYSSLIKDKVIVKPILKQVSLLSNEDKEKILEIFNYDEFQKDFSSDAVILLTEAYYESDLLSFEEEIEIYSEMIWGYDEVIIKPHPRDKKEYNKYFPNCKILKSYFPLEILYLVDINIKKLLTVESTAVFNFDCEVEFFEGKINNEYINKSRKRIKNQYFKLHSKEEQ